MNHTSKAFDVISIGSAVIDVLLRSKAFQPTAVHGEMMLCEIYGGKADVEMAKICSGGAGTNTAVSFSRQGLRACVIAEVGKDIGSQIIRDELQREVVDTSYLIEEETEQTGMSALLVAQDGSRSALTFRGAARMLTHKDIPFEVLQETNHIHLSAIGNPDLIRELFLFCQNEKISLSWNPSASELEEIFFKSGRSFEQAVKVLCLNDQEFAVVKQKPEVLSHLAEIVLLTKGKTGGEIWEHGNVTPFAAAEIHTVVDETGAGDAFVSGFMGSILRQQSISESLQFAIKNAGSVVQYLGAKEGLLRV